MRNLTQSTIRISKLFKPMPLFFFSTKMFARATLNYGSLSMINKF
jgi:hypothetical protein